MTVYYLQKEYEGLPKGTPMVACQPTADHHLAKAMLGGNVIPTGYYKLLGSDETGEVHAIPRFENIVDEVHPQCLTRIGVCVLDLDATKVDVDRLPTGESFRVIVLREHPRARIVVVLDDRQCAINRVTADEIAAVAVSEMVLHNTICANSVDKIIHAIENAMP